jgi:hypothetical protein
MRLTPLSLSGTKQSNGHTTAPKTHTQTCFHYRYCIFLMGEMRYG